MINILNNPLNCRINMHELFYLINYLEHFLFKCNFIFRVKIKGRIDKQLVQFLYIEGYTDLL